ncbi:kinase-like domain-containing protein [Mycena alexandri]|uniref:Kinase-like domain-containing protein n=1 Tax=Mycena alexandri TaxID=1745969 RepID=A0AAD6SZ09_9AGAR|nr:kinase-like domain-containing protein [Mycena alexandri]
MFEFLDPTLTVFAQSNIFITHDRIACLADFGLSSFLQLQSDSSNRAGSFRWMAPELIDPGSFGCPKFERTTASDVYAYACVCLELHTGHPPFSDVASDGAVLLNVHSGKRPARPDTSMSDDLWALVTTAWAQNFLDRPSMKTISGIMRAAARLPKHS